jgi:AmmeMemoRadiSam system protein B
MVVPLVTVALVAVGAQVTIRTRRPVGPGVWYPADAAQLRAAVQQYLNESDIIPLPGRFVACVAPQASYQVSGAVAACAFKPLKQGQFDRVIVLTGSNYASFNGCSIPSVQLYRTPLGDIELDGPAIQRLTVSPHFSLRSVVYRDDAYTDPEIRRAALHEREHGIEVLLPFLQVQLGSFKLVPIVIGDLKAYRGGTDDHAVERVAHELRGIIDDQTFVVVSTDFTRYGAVHNYTPFRKDILSNIAALDLEAFRLVGERDYAGFEAYLDRTQNPIGGHIPLLCLMKMLDPNARGVMLRYDTSGRITGNPERSVSFAAIAFFDPTLPPDSAPPEQTMGDAEQPPTMDENSVSQQ